MNEFQITISCQGRVQTNFIQRFTDPWHGSNIFGFKILDSEEFLVSTFVGCCSADGYGFAPSWIKNEGQGTRDKAYKAMSDYVETYGYKPESFAAIKYAFTGKILYDS